MTDSGEKTSDVLVEISSLFQDTNIHIASFGNYGHEPLNYFLRSGYKHLYGYSNDPIIYNLPYYHKIKFVPCDYLNSHLPNSMFDVIFLYLEDFIQMSQESKTKFTIEANRLSKSHSVISLVLKKDSSDLEQSNTITMFTEFFTHLAKIHSALNIKFTLSDRKISQHVSYSFVNMYLDKAEISHNLKSIHLVVPTLGLNEGQSEYGKALASKFKSYGVVVDIDKHLPARNADNGIFILEYEPHLNIDIPNVSGMVIDLHFLPSDTKLFQFYDGRQFLFKQPIETTVAWKIGKIELFWIYLAIFLKNPFGTVYFYLFGLRKKLLSMRWKRRPSIPLENIIQKVDYTIVPHIEWPYECPKETNVVVASLRKPLKIGSFGFASPLKRVELICELAVRLQIPALILMSISNANDEERIISEKYAYSIQRKYENDLIKVEVGFFDPCYIFEKLESCTHIIFAQSPIGQTSGSMRLAISTGLPVISTDSPQARDAQVFRIRTLKEINLDYLESHRESIHIDDGFYYLINFLRYNYKY